MKLTDEQLSYYVQNVLALGREDKEKFQTQIDHLKDTLEGAIARNSSLKVMKILQAGSWKKGDALKPRDGQVIDIDLVLFLNVKEAEKQHVDALHGLIIDLLVAAYPTKKREDFPPGKRTVGIVFHTTGLNVDLVPVIPVPDPDGYVWQPEIGGGGAFQTSVVGQLEFIRKIKEAEPRFTQIVRLAKRWRNYSELEDMLSSFAIELLVSHIVLSQGPTRTLEEGIIRFFLFVAQSELKQAITFTGAIRSLPGDLDSRPYLRPDQ